MAEIVLSVVAEEILGKLISLATEQISLAWGFKDELTRLRDSLTMIQAVLADAERRLVREEFVRLWLQRLKDVAYDADDVLDELAYEILKRKVEIRNQMKRKVCFFFSFSNPIAFRCKMANKVKTIAESLKRINDEANQYGLTRVELVNANPKIIPSHRETDSSLDHSEVVGRKDLVSEIVELLLNAANQRLSVIPIVGMAVNCNKCSKIPTLGHLPRLRVLQIEKMENVRCIGTEFYINYGGERSSHNGGGSGRNVVFPALKTLVLRRLPNLVEWKDAMELTTIETVFPCLEELNIVSCGQLTSAPYHFPSLKKLDIYKIKSTAFERIISELTTLTSLEIRFISELACLPEQLLQNNRSLMSIYISNCSDLVSIPAYQDVTSLQSFRISGCEKLSELSIALLTLPSLETFEVSGCPNLRSFPSLQGAGSLLPSLAISCGDEVLPTALQSCMSLSSLSIKECPNLILIPELRKLHSLTKLEICDCPNLKSIPDLGELHSLTQLSILRCQTLKLTCLPEELEFVTRLKYLAIGGFCEELDAFPSLSSIQHLHTSLESLDLYGWAKLNSLPEEIQHFTSLKYLYINNFDGLEALPEWLSNFSSLQSLGKMCKRQRGRVVQNRPYSRCQGRLTFFSVFPKYVSWHYGAVINLMECIGDDISIVYSWRKNQSTNSLSTVRANSSSLELIFYCCHLKEGCAAGKIALRVQKIASYSYPLIIQFGAKSSFGYISCSANNGISLQSNRNMEGARVPQY
nr:putative disease resistance protein rga1 [Quercus suber]